MSAYTTERIKTIIDYRLREFLVSEARNVAEMFEHVTDFDWSTFDFDAYVRENFLWVAYYKERPVGVMMARRYHSIWDVDKWILMQDLLYCKKSSGKAAYLLMKQFIAFGRAHADLAFTMTTKRTNVKGRTLERLGFEKVEELYRMRV